MSTRRRMLIHALFVVVFGGHLVCLLLGRQLWPYSHYPMFADARESDLLSYETLVLVGERAGGEELWFEDQGLLTSAVSPMIVTSVFTAAQGRGADQVHERLRETYDFYESLRTRGRTGTPRLERLVLYAFRWQLRPDLSNLRTPVRRRIATYSPGDAAIR